MKYTTNLGLQSAMLALESYGIDVAELLVKEGLSVPPGRNYDEHIPTRIAGQLVELAVRETGDQAFGLKIAEYIYPTTLKEFGISLLSSNTLQDFVQRLAKYYPVLATSQKLHFVKEQGRAVLTTVFADASIGQTAQWVWVDVPMAFAVRFIRMMYKPDYAPLKLELTRPLPTGSADRYRDYFGITPCFDAPRNALYFDPEELDVSLPGRDPDLAAEQDVKLMKRLASLNSDNLPMQVHSLLLEELSSHRLLQKKYVASHFSMSPKTFHNRLHEAGTSFQKLLDGVRLELAEQYLPRSDLSLAAVADRLGYSDASNFTRAYKRWTGHLPNADLK